MTTAAATRWAMKGTGYEYCNCARPSGRVIKRQNQHGWWRRQVRQTPGSASRARG